MPKASPSKIKEKRKQYEAVRRLYKQTGKKAQGKAKTSVAYREYKTVKREYKRIGGELGRMTGRKARR